MLALSSISARVEVRVLRTPAATGQELTGPILETLGGEQAEPSTRAAFLLSLSLSGLRGLRLGYSENPHSYASYAGYGFLRRLLHLRS